MSKRLIVNPGDVYGRWTVIGEPDPTQRPRKIACRCVCGTEKEVNLSNLVRGVSTSCGCTHGDKRRGKPSGKHKDITGARYGHLTAVSFIHHDYWLWQCDCGEQKRIRASLVKDGKIVSCGCVLSDKARKKILEQNVLQQYDGTQVSKLRKAVAGTSRPRPGNTSGHVGVRVRVCPDGVVKYSASITLRRKTINLGTYETLDEAIAARKAGEQKYYAPIVEQFDADT